MKRVWAILLFVTYFGFFPFTYLSKDIDTLPEEAQILLLDFIQLLKKRYPQPENHHQEKSIYEKFDEIGLIGCCAVLWKRIYQPHIKKFYLIIT
ncbi:MAG: hypothetical protein HEQ24_19505 [Dolichospermum sp. BR01]|nr:hypothetical protein [Dolichospermum sp. BR01]